MQPTDVSKQELDVFFMANTLSSLVYDVNLLINGDSETGPCVYARAFANVTQWSSSGSIIQSNYIDIGYCGPTFLSSGPRNVT